MYFYSALYYNCSKENKIACNQVSITKKKMNPFKAPDHNTSLIPVTIITGFLGSGKTTFLNNIIKKYPDTRFAIIENEFGEMPVDGELINHNQSPFFELANGCICCSLTGELLKALYAVIEKKESIDHLLVETTGIADPMSVIDVFISNKDMCINFEINSVVCIADACNLSDTLTMEIEARKQVALSDLVIMNKMDTVDKTKLPQLSNTLNDINPLAEILQTTYAQTNGTPLLNKRAYSGEDIEKSTMEFENLNFSLENFAKNLHPYRFNSSRHKHDIHAEGFVFDDCTDMELFNIWMSSYLYFNQNRLYRVKGVINFKNKNNRYVFQSVKGSYVFDEGRKWEENETRFSKIVFIGKYVNREELESSLLKLFNKKLPEPCGKG